MLETVSAPSLFPWLALLLGLMVGSFLNVVVHRLPRMLSREWRSQALDVIGEWAQEGDAPGAVRRSAGALGDVRQSLREAPRFNLGVPRSACPRCGYKITALQNIPVVSWLWLRGRCKGCGAAISRRYPVVEGITGMLSGYIAWRFGFSLATAAALVFCWAMIAATFIDLDTMYLPDDITLPLLWLGLLVNLAAGAVPDLFFSADAQPPLPLPGRLDYAVIGAAAGYLSLWSVYWTFKLVTGKEGMGFGDFKLLAAIGAWFGWVSLLPVVLISSMVGALIGISLILLRKHAREKPIPFGPYLASAGLIYMFFGRQLAAYVFG